MRAALVLQARARFAADERTRTRGWRRRPRAGILGLFLRRPARAAMAGLMLVAVASGAAFATSGPGGPLYPVRLWAETLTLPSGARAAHRCRAVPTRRPCRGPGGRRDRRERCRRDRRDQRLRGRAGRGTGRGRRRPWPSRDGGGGPRAPPRRARVPGGTRSLHGRSGDRRRPGSCPGQDRRGPGGRPPGRPAVNAAGVHAAGVHAAGPAIGAAESTRRHSAEPEARQSVGPPVATAALDAVAEGSGRTAEPPSDAAESAHPSPGG